MCVALVALKQMELLRLTAIDDSTENLGLAIILSSTISFKRQVLLKWSIFIAHCP